MLDVYSITKLQIIYSILCMYAARLQVRRLFRDMALPPLVTTLHYTP